MSDEIRTFFDTFEQTSAGSDIDRMVARCTSTKLVSVEETPLDDRYVMAKTVWRWEFPTPVEPIVLPSTYIIRRGGKTPQIVFYLTGDVLSVLRSRGLLPAANA